jgi:signal transduction histidine kinase
MRRLFLKTFLWFWVVVILAIVALFVPNIYFGYWLQAKWSRTSPGLLEASSREAVATLERSGESGLLQYFGQLEREYSVRATLFRGEEALGPRMDGEAGIRFAAHIAVAQEGPYIRGTMAAQRIDAASGKNYVLVLAFWPYPTPYWILAEVALAILAAGGLFCFLITRHVTSPLFKLRAAAASIAEGHLEVRVSPVLGRRADEIADLARDFDRMAERIQSLLDGQKRLLGDVSHELRSPLARLMVALTMAERASPTETGRYLERIKLEAHRLDHLIGQLLMLSRIDSGVEGTERVLIDLDQLVQEIADDANFEAQSTAARVTVECAGRCTVNGSVEVLRSAIENAVRNAVRHTSEGTAVEITVWRNGSAAVLHVQDHGTGVPESMLAEIFLPFHKVPRMNTNGAGLGLAITERAVRAHGGSVRAQNVAEGGLLVEMTLPLRDGLLS